MSGNNSKIGEELQSKIIRYLYGQAEKVGWTTLPAGKRTSMYSQWLENPDVGGRLTQLMSQADARVWLKDGPMKEYARARYGIGKYADCIANSSIRVNKLLTQALGAKWNVDKSQTEIKPLRLRAFHEEDEIIFAWAPYKDFKHLVWAAVNAYANGDHTRWVLGVVDSFEDPTPKDLKATHQRIANRCRLEIAHVREDW